VLGFKRVEKTFHRRIIPTLTLAANAWRHAVTLKALLVRMTCVLAPTV